MLNLPDLALRARGSAPAARTARLRRRASLRGPAPCRRTLKLQPGQSFSEQEVAEKLGVSRTPVREAVIGLAEAGLLEVLPQRGTFVRKISIKAVMDARFVREAIELAVLREAVGRLPASFFAATRALLRASARLLPATISSASSARRCVPPRLRATRSTAATPGRVVEARRRRWTGCAF